MIVWFKKILINQHFRLIESVVKSNFYIALENFNIFIIKKFCSFSQKNTVRKFESFYALEDFL